MGIRLLFCPLSNALDLQTKNPIIQCSPFVLCGIKSLIDINVCGMFDLGETEGAHFITMECVRGEDLRSSIRRFGQLPIGKSISVAKQICDGLSEAHRLGVVHRDRKRNFILG